MESSVTGPANLYALTLGGAIALCFSAFMFVVTTASGFCPLCLPSLSLRLKDPSVMALLGVFFFGFWSGVSILIGQNVVSYCHVSHKVGGTLFAWTYSCVNLFLLLKLRAVEAGLKAKWYLKLQRIVNLSTLGSPAFGIVVAVVLRGFPVYDPSGRFFCALRSVWYLSIAFAVLQCFLTVGYFILFLMPLISTEKHLIALRTGDMGQSVHDVIVRNFIGCLCSTVTTSVVMTCVTVAFLQKSPVPGMWGVSFVYLDMMVTVFSCMYVIRPAWKYVPVVDGQFKLHTTSKEQQQQQEPQAPSGGIVRWLMGRGQSQGRHTLSPSKEHASIKRVARDKDTDSGNIQPSWGGSTQPGSTVTQSPSQSLVLGVAANKEESVQVSTTIQQQQQHQQQQQQQQQGQNPLNQMDGAIVVSVDVSVETSVVATS